MRKLKDKCKNCDKCYLVTKTTNHGPLDEPYYQCIADKEDECVDGCIYEDIPDEEVKEVEEVESTAVKKLYNECTKEERDKMQEIWVRLLDGFCPPDAIGNRPCDNGVLCDKCHYDYELQKKYNDTIEKEMRIRIIEED